MGKRKQTIFKKRWFDITNLNPGKQEVACGVIFELVDGNCSFAFSKARKIPLAFNQSTGSKIHTTGENPRDHKNLVQPKPEPEFLNVYGAQESIPRNEFRQPM